MRGDRQQIVFQARHVALRGHIAKYDDAARQPTSRITQRRTAEAQHLTTVVVYFDLQVAVGFAAAQRLQHRPKCLGHSLCAERKLTPSLAVESLPKHDTGADLTEHGARGPVEALD